jgi:hypothetical protein
LYRDSVLGNPGTLDRFYSILAQSVATQGRHSAAKRVDIYDRARIQLEQLIAHTDPPMPAETERSYREGLEHAIARIESEYSGSADAHNLTAEAVADALAERHRHSHDETGAKASSQGAPSGEGFAPASAKPGDMGPVSVYWGDDRTRTRGFLRIGGPIVFLAAVLGAFLFGVWLLLSSIFAPSLPGMDAVARRLERTGTAVLFAGTGAERLKTPDEATATNVPELFGPGAVRIESRVKNAKAKRLTGGVRMQLDRTIRSLLEDSTLRAVVVARAAPDNPSPEFALAISTGGKRTSGWQRFELDDTYRTYAVEYAFGRDAIDNPAIISVLADLEGEGRAVEVREISLRVVPN